MDFLKKQFFEDETASEFLSSLDGTDPDSYILSILNDSESSKYIPYNLGQRILIAAALMDAITCGIQTI